LFLKNVFVKDKLRKIFARKTLLNQFIEAKQRFYEHLQQIFSDKKFLHHVDNIRKLFVDVDIFKKRNIETMISHVKKNLEKKIAFNRFDIQSVMFLNKILTNAKIRYWSTKLKMIEIVWIIKKIRHLIEFSRKSFAIIFTNHSALIEIIKQTSFTSSNTNKLNLRLMKISQYLLTFSIEIRVKSEKFHITFDVLFRLFFVMNKDQSTIDEKSVLKNLQYDIDVMIIQSISEWKSSSFDVRSTHISSYLNTYFEQEECLIEMTNEYRKFLLTSYDNDVQWSKLKNKLHSRESLDDIFDEMILFITHQKKKHSSSAFDEL
jgi:hypothetical protein